MSQFGNLKLSRSRRSQTRRASVFVAVLAVVMTFLSPLMPSAQAVVAPVGQGFTVTAGDLSFILKQIRIAERHAATLTPAEPCGTLVGPAKYQIPDRLTSYGLRTVDGSCNDLFPDRTGFGAADQQFPRLTSPRFRDADPASSFPVPLLPGSVQAGGGTSYSTLGDVVDSQPRTISNLIVDQTSTNPAAVAAAGFPVRTQNNTGLFVCGSPGAPAAPDCVPEHKTLFIPNVTTDVGLSPPYNSLFTFFGQFFDHGVDQTVKSGATVYVPLKDDDPLRTLGPDGDASTPDQVPASQAFMVLTRAQNQPGPDGVLGTSDDVQDANNTDTPWVDQSQTYTSHASHQVFLREYALVGGRPDATGKLLGGLPAGQTYPGSADGQTGMSTWASTKAQAASVLGLQLTDYDVTNIPMLATDPYGEFIPGSHGFPQYALKDGTLVEGDPAADGGKGVSVPANVRHFDTPFLTDIAHNADPSRQDCDHNGSPETVPVPDGNTTIETDFTLTPCGQYDDELLHAHFTAGDGRVNENIALTTIHQIFHSEHDRLIDDIKATLNAPANAALLADYQNVAPNADDPAPWSYGNRLFQAARFVTEMEYQHLVFEEFARKVQPAVRPFHVYNPDVNAAIPAEFAHAVYRFGHSMLDDTVARKDPGGADNSLPLLKAFLNPPEYQHAHDGSALTPEQAAGSVVMGSSDQVGNELDEFVTETLRNNLLGLPLDLPTLNMARAREAGVPPLNDVRRQINAKTNDAQMTPYTSWTDFGQHLKHPESLINFVAAYGTHPSITGATTLAAKRAAAKAIVDPSSAPASDPATIPADSAAFMFSSDGSAMPGCELAGADCRDWSSPASGVTTTGLDQVDLWVGGLAEVTNLFGGLLGSTFNYVFQNTLENLQDHDRFYYLFRTPGMNLRTQLEGNSFSEMIQRNTDGTSTLKADAFATADCKFQLGNLNGTAAYFDLHGSTVADDITTPDCDESLLLLRKADGTIQYRAKNSVDPSGINGQSVYNGTPGTDRVNGGNDNDTFWGGDGRDFIEGNGGDDVALGGDGNDIVTDLDGADVEKGGPGNDALDGGPGDDIFMGGDGQDFINGGANDNEAFAGPGTDFVIAGQGADAVFGDGGDDWIEGGSGQDLLQGDHGAPFFDDPAESAPGSDVFVGQVGENDYDAEGGDDLMSQNDGVDRNAGAGGFDWAFHQYDTVGADDDMSINNFLVGAPIQVVVNRDRWQETEADSGSAFNDVIRGTDDVPSAVGGAGFTGCDVLDQAGVDRITGLAALLPALSGNLAPVVAASAAGSCPLAGPIWGDGDILLGGAGSDLLEGRGANDIIDGDKALNVRISVRNPADPTIEIGSTDLMEHVAKSGSFGANTAGETLQKAVFDGDVDPGNLVIVREIVAPPASDAGSIDTAKFTGARAGYSLTFGAGSVTVTDTAGTDGTDTLRGIERLQFSDGIVDISTAPPTPVIGTAVAGNAQATVNWTAGAPNGSTPTNQFQIQVIANGVPQAALITGIAANATSRIVTGLTNGTSYTFKVLAVNQVGLSSPLSAASNPVIPNNPAPEVLSSSPANASTGASLTADLTVTFDETITGFNANSVILRNPAGTTLPTALAFNTTTHVLTVNPAANLLPGTTYTLTLLGTLPGGGAGIRNAAGLRLANTVITFTTANDTTPPTVTGVNPANGATRINPNTNVAVTFSERVVGASSTTVVLTNVATGVSVTAGVTLNAAGTVATLNPNVNLARNTLYEVSVVGGPTAIRDSAGNALAGPITSRFTTR
ncbi:Ca2+-binding RTX toxin-like protein/methionine-rich copper-binding protein CopC [Marmoricola sp. URHA0025 HA25]